MLRRIVLQMLQRLLGGAENLVAPIEELAAEIGPLHLIHERLVIRRPIILGESLLLFFRSRHESHIQTPSIRRWLVALP
jgi:hypothetical protein